MIEETDNTSTTRHDQIRLSDAFSEAYQKYMGRLRLPRARLNLNLNRPCEGRTNLNGDGDLEPPPAG